MARPKHLPPYSKFNPDDGPWLIWSHYHSAWHMRTSSGSAGGYTFDITQAGVFDAAKAGVYHDDPHIPRASRRDEAIPAAKVVKAMRAAWHKQLDELIDTAIKVRQLEQGTKR